MRRPPLDLGRASGDNRGIDTTSTSEKSLRPPHMLGRAVDFLTSARSAVAPGRRLHERISARRIDRGDVVAIVQVVGAAAAGEDAAAPREHV